MTKYIISSFYAIVYDYITEMLEIKISTGFCLTGLGIEYTFYTDIIFVICNYIMMSFEKVPNEYNHEWWEISFYIILLRSKTLNNFFSSQTLYYNIVIFKKFIFKYIYTVFMLFIKSWVIYYFITTMLESINDFHTYE